MIRNLYSMRDVKAGFLPPFVDVNDETACRGFLFALRKPGTLEYSNIQDFSLYKVGTYNDETGELVPMDKSLICEGCQLSEENEVK